MTIVMKRFTKGIILRGEVSDVSDNIEGSLFQNSTDLRLKAYIEGAVRQIVTNSQSQVLTNKTIDVDNNTVSNIETDNLKAGVLNTSTTLASASDTQLPSALAVKTYVDNSVASKDQASEISYSNATSGLTATNVQDAVDEIDNNVDNLVSLSGVALDSTNLGSFTGTTIPDNQTVKQALQSLETAHETHTGASTNVHGLGVGSSVVGTTDSQALTNKTLTGAVINGSTKISAFLLEESEDNSQSGSLVTLTGFTKPIVRLTNASLVSVTGLSASELTGHGGVVTLINTTANEITVLNNAGTASEAILTGIDDDVDLAPNGCLLLKYDTVSDKWRVIGGTGGSNVIIKALAGENLTARQAVYLSIGASDGGRTAGSAYKINASNDNRIEFVGFVKETVTSGSTAKIVTSGILKGFTGLSVGVPLYLDTSIPGAYTQTEPTAAQRWVIRLGIAISSTQILIMPDQAASAFFNTETQTQFIIANNQSVAANINNLIFDGATTKTFLVDYGLFRSTSTVSYAQAGRLRGVYNSTSNNWFLSDDYSGENAGVNFSITSTGQVQYTSSNLAGLSYSGIFQYRISAGDGVSPSSSSSVSGVGGINYISNFDFETNAAGYTTYQDAAAVAPVDGISGSPASTFARVTSGVLRGVGSGKLTKPSGASRQGEGVSYDFTIDAADQAQVLRISFDYSTSANYADGNIRVYVLDKSSNALIEVIDRDLLASIQGKFVGTFQTSPASTDYRLILHIADSVDSDWDVTFDNIIVGPQTIVKGAIVTDWESDDSVVTFSNVTGVLTSFKKRVGDTLSIKGTLTLSSTPTGVMQLVLASGYSLDFTKISSNIPMGTISFRKNSIPSESYLGFFSPIAATNSFNLLTSRDTVNTGTSYISNNAAVSTTVPFTWASGDLIRFEISDIPIQGWSSNVVLSEDAGSREIILLATDVAGTLSSAAFAYNDLNFTVIQKDTTASYTTAGYTIPESGEYDITLGCAITYGTVPVAGNDLSVGIKVNSGDYKVCFQKTTGTTAQYYPSGKWTVSLNKGDLVTPYFRKQGTEALTFLNATDDRFQYFTIAKRSSPQTIAASEVVACSYYNTSGQPVVNSSPILFDTLIYDTHNSYNTSTGNWTCPQSGYYRFEAKIQTLAVSAAIGNLFVITISGYTGQYDYCENTTARSYNSNISLTKYVSKGEVINFNFGESLPTVNLTSVSSQNYMSITKINGVS